MQCASETNSIEFVPREAESASFPVTVTPEFTLSILTAIAAMGTGTAATLHQVKYHKTIIGCTSGDD
jgi:hypothetical protein